jgi:hypothetical protein
MGNLALKTEDTIIDNTLLEIRLIPMDLQIEYSYR